MIRFVALHHYAFQVEEARTFLPRVDKQDLRPWLADDEDDIEHVLMLTRHDCDWQSRTVRCLVDLAQKNPRFLPPLVVGPMYVETLGLGPGNEVWLFTVAQDLKNIPNVARVFRTLKERGVNIFYYSFDEASRNLPCFGEIAPYLDVLIYDEFPPGPAREFLSVYCKVVNKCWVGNFIPYFSPFNEHPEEKILFLGSKFGMTENRERQIAALKEHFWDRFVCITDHSISENDMASLNRYKVCLCPEGRKFTSESMSESHTDRPFWAGMLGMVPLSENSKWGNRLRSLTDNGLLIPHAHHDTESLLKAAETALAVKVKERRRIYQHFNQSETLRSVIEGVFR